MDIQRNKIFHPYGWLISSSWSSSWRLRYLCYLSFFLHISWLQHCSCLHIKISILHVVSCHDVHVGTKLVREHCLEVLPSTWYMIYAGIVEDWTESLDCSLNGNSPSLSTTSLLTEKPLLVRFLSINISHKYTSNIWDFNLLVSCT